jgi:hypothetical protein
MNMHRSAAAVLSLASLLLFPACGSTPAATVAKPKSPTKFALLMYERDDALAGLPRAEHDILLRKYILWIKNLEDTGVVKHRTSLGRGGVRIAPGPRGEPFASPLGASGESLTEIFVLETSDPAEAERIAATCPALGHGETIHIRPILRD